MLIEMFCSRQDVLAQCISSSQPDAAVVVPGCNAGFVSCLGIEACGRRILNCLEDLERKWQSVVSFSIVGHSLGGLVALWLAGSLYQARLEGRFRWSFNRLITIATPHVGKVGSTNFRSRLSGAFAGLALGRSGMEMALVDKNSASNQPIITDICHPDGIFMKAANSFDDVWVVANTLGDASVSWASSGAPFVGDAVKAAALSVYKDFPAVYITDSLAVQFPTLQCGADVNTTAGGCCACFKAPLLFVAHMLALPLLPLVLLMLVCMMCVRCLSTASVSDTRVPLIGSLYDKHTTVGSGSTLAPVEASAVCSTAMARTGWKPLLAKIPGCGAHGRIVCRGGQINDAVAMSVPRIIGKLFAPRQDDP